MGRSYVEPSSRINRLSRFIRSQFLYLTIHSFTLLVLKIQYKLLASNVNFLPAITKATGWLINFKIPALFSTRIINGVCKIFKMNLVIVPRWNQQNYGHLLIKWILNTPSINPWVSLLTFPTLGSGYLCFRDVIFFLLIIWYNCIRLWKTNGRHSFNNI